MVVIQALLFVLAIGWHKVPVTIASISVKTGDLLCKFGQRMLFHCVLFWFRFPVLKVQRAWRLYVARKRSRECSQRPREGFSQDLGTGATRSQH